MRCCPSRRRRLLFVFGLFSLVWTAGCLNDDTLLVNARPFLAVLTPDSLAVTEGGNAETLRIILNRPTVDSLSIALTASDPAAIGLPSAVIIPINGETAVFVIEALEDSDLDSEVVTITAQSSAFFAVATVQVSDNDVPPPTAPPLVMRIEPEQLCLLEGGGAETVRVTLNQGVNTDLNVAVRQTGGVGGDVQFYDLAGQVPLANLTIPSGQVSGSFVVLPKPADADSSGALFFIECDAGSVNASALVELLDEQIGIPVPGLGSASRPLLLGDGSLVLAAEALSGEGSAGFSASIPGRLRSIASLALPQVGSIDLPADAGTFADHPGAQPVYGGELGGGFLIAGGTSGPDGLRSQGSDAAWLATGLTPLLNPLQLGVGLDSLEISAAGVATFGASDQLLVRAFAGGDPDSGALVIVDGLGGLPSESTVVLGALRDGLSRPLVPHVGLALLLGADSTRLLSVDSATSLNLVARFPEQPDSLVVLSRPTILGPDRVALLVRRFSAGDTAYLALLEGLESSPQLTLLSVGAAVATQAGGGLPVAAPGVGPHAFDSRRVAVVTAGPDGIAGTADDVLRVFRDLAQADGDPVDVVVGPTLVRDGSRGGAVRFLSSDRLALPVAGTALTALGDADDGLLLVRDLNVVPSTLYLALGALDEGSDLEFFNRATVFVPGARDGVAPDTVHCVYGLDGSTPTHVLQVVPRALAPGRAGQPLVVKPRVLAYAHVGAGSLADADDGVGLLFAPSSAGEAQLTLDAASLTRVSGETFDVVLRGHNLHALAATQITLTGSRSYTLLDASFDNGEAWNLSLPLRVRINPSGSGSITLTVELSSPVGEVQRSFQLSAP